MNHCRILDKKEIYVDSVSEPVGLTEMKQWLKITYNDEDSVITELITAVRAAIEAYCSISVVLKSLTVVVEVNPANNRSRIEMTIPFTPIDIESLSVSILKCDGSGYEAMTSGTDYYTIGYDGQKIVFMRPGIYRLEYDSEPVNLDGVFKQAIKTEVANWYENRGDIPGSGLSEMTKRKVQQYKQMAWV